MKKRQPGRRKNQSGEIPTISSELRWEEVLLPPSVSEAAIDRIIFAELRPVARKVALIVGSAAVRSGEELAVEVSPEIFAARLQKLADDAKWRFSEVSLQT